MNSSEPLQAIVQVVERDSSSLLWWALKAAPPYPEECRLVQMNLHPIRSLESRQVIVRKMQVDRHISPGAVVQVVVEWRGLNAGPPYPEVRPSVQNNRHPIRHLFFA
jgi:hypothetical protein